MTLRHRLLDNWRIPVLTARSSGSPHGTEEGGGPTPLWIAELRRFREGEKGDASWVVASTDDRMNKVYCEWTLWVAVKRSQAPNGPTPLRWLLIVDSFLESGSPRGLDANKDVL